MGFWSPIFDFQALLIGYWIAFSVVWAKISMRFCAWYRIFCDWRLKRRINAQTFNINKILLIYQKPSYPLWHFLWSLLFQRNPGIKKKRQTMPRFLTKNDSIWNLVVKGTFEQLAVKSCDQIGILFHMSLQNLVNKGTTFDRLALGCQILWSNQYSILKVEEK